MTGGGGGYLMDDPSREEIVEALTGWTITEASFDPAVEGGLCLELLRAGRRKQLVLGFTELGMWIERQTEEAPTRPASCELRLTLGEDPEDAKETS